METLLKKLNGNNPTVQNLIKEQPNAIYEILYDLQQGVPVNNVPNYKISSDVFKEAREYVSALYEFLENPFTVIEGADSCNFCGSRRIYSYQRQTRSCDEPSTTFSTCVDCKKKWIYN